MAIESDRITADMVDCADFPELVERYQISGVPKIVFNDVVQLLGAHSETVFLDAVLRAASAVDQEADAARE